MFTALMSPKGRNSLMLLLRLSAVVLFNCHTLFNIDPSLSTVHFNNYNELIIDYFIVLLILHGACLYFICYPIIMNWIELN